MKYLFNILNMLVLTFSLVSPIYASHGCPCEKSKLTERCHIDGIRVEYFDYFFDGQRFTSGEIAELPFPGVRRVMGVQVEFSPCRVSRGTVQLLEGADDAVFSVLDVDNDVYPNSRLFKTDKKAQNLKLQVYNGSVCIERVRVFLAKCCQRKCNH